MIHKVASSHISHPMPMKHGHELLKARMTLVFIAPLIHAIEAHEKWGLGCCVFFLCLLKTLEVQMVWRAF